MGYPLIAYTTNPYSLKTYHIFKVSEDHFEIKDSTTGTIVFTADSKKASVKGIKVFHKHDIAGEKVTVIGTALGFISKTKN